MSGWQEQVADTARRYGELDARLARTTVTETSRDGVVRVTVGADGSMVDLVLLESRQPLSMAALAAKIMSCVSRARARLPDLIARAMAETVGHDKTADLVLADARSRFPPVPAEAAPHRREVAEEPRMVAPPRGMPPPAVAPPPHRGDDRDDDWNETAIFENP
ncbi:YbaB/EbfC family nucleoid-associated protein [Lentzea sp. HUAS TT2]|uniref:YbaB/EbfC family nucleoid-associated protein n=1 Tax=Lentzea sp. HUAS TT2 TaxID=3447454 RepID=UPI003F718D36